MLRYLLLFSALCAYINLLQSPAHARRSLVGGLIKGAAQAATRRSTSSHRRSQPAKPAKAMVPQTPPETGSAPDAPAALPPGTMDVNRRFQTIEDPLAPKKSEVAPIIRSAPDEPIQPPYPEPPTSSPLFQSVSLPPSREPSWIRTQRLHALLLPPAPRPVARVVAAKPAPFTGKCLAVRDANHIVVTHGARQELVELCAVAPATGKNGRAAQKALSDLVLNKPVTVYPAKHASERGAWVFNGQKCANSELISRGLARVQPKAAPVEPKLAALERSARKAKRGVWAKS